MKINPIQCYSVKQLLLDFFKLKNDVIMSKKVSFFDIHGKTKRMTLKQCIKVIRSIGIWGYCEIEIHKKPIKQNNIIYYWHRKNISKMQIYDFLGHELSHIFGVRSEKTASLYGMISAIAYRIDKTHLKTVLEVKKA